MTQKRERYTSPVCKFGYPCFVDEPDTNFDPIGSYKVRLILDPEETKTKEFIATLEAAFDRHVEECKDRAGKTKIKIDSENRPWGPELDREGEETGMIAIRTKLAARVEPKNTNIEPWDQSPKVFDQYGKPHAEGEVPRVGPGSTGQVGGQIHLWYNSAKGAGMTLWCEGIMVKDLVEKTSGSATAGGFGFGVSEQPGLEDLEFQA